MDFKEKKSFFMKKSIILEKFSELQASAT